MSKLKFSRITQDEQAKSSVSALSVRPNIASSYGQGNLSGKELQAWFDKLAKLVINRYNAVVEAFDTNAILDYIGLPEKMAVETLKELINNNFDENGNLIVADPTVEGNAKNTISAILTVLLGQIAEVSIDIGTQISAHDRNTEAHDIPIQISNHNKNTEAHPDIRQRIDNIPDQTDGKINKHNSDANAHPVIRNSIQANSAAIAAVPGQIDGKITEHNVNNGAHNDIRIALKGLADRLAAVLDSDDETLDELSEIVAYIKSNKNLIDAITISKVSVSDVINNLMTNASNKPLSAAQGVALKAIADSLGVDISNLRIEKLNKTDVVDNLTSEGSMLPLSANQGYRLNLRINELGTGGSGGFTEAINNQILEVFGTNGSFGLEYDIEDAGATFIGIGDCTDKAVTIGSRARGIPVTKIAESALENNQDIISITIPDSVTSFGENGRSFAECSNLLSASIGDGVTTIQEFTFYNCSSLTTVYIGKNVKKINTSAFDGTAIANVYFGGTEDEWNAINFTTENDILLSAIIQYEKSPREVKHGRTI